MTIPVFELDIQIPEQDAESYRLAVEAGDLMKLKSILLAVCSDEERGLVEHLLPAELINQCQPIN